MDIDAQGELLRMAVLVQDALAALEDEAEGAFTDAVVELEQRADKLGELVRTW